MNESILNQPRSIMGRPTFFLLWVAVTVGGWAAWLVFSTIPIVEDTVDVQSSNELTYIGLFIIGGGIGLGQWLLLKRQFPIASYEWMIFTIIGFGVGSYGLIWAALRDNYIIFSPPGSPILEWDPLVGGALLGLALGCCQSLVWRPRFDRMAAWIVVNVFGWSLGMFLPQFLAFQLGGTNTPWLSTLFPIVFGAVLTGLALVRFMKES